jgi:hypothetical protein
LGFNNHFAPQKELYIKRKIFQGILKRFDANRKWIFWLAIFSAGAKKEAADAMKRNNKQSKGYIAYTPSIPIRL